MNGGLLHVGSQDPFEDIRTFLQFNNQRIFPSIREHVGREHATAIADLLDVASAPSVEPSHAAALAQLDSSMASRAASRRIDALRALRSRALGAECAAHCAERVWACCARGGDEAAEAVATLRVISPSSLSEYARRLRATVADVALGRDARVEALDAIRALGAAYAEIVGPSLPTMRGGGFVGAQPGLSPTAAEDLYLFARTPADPLLGGQTSAPERFPKGFVHAVGRESNACYAVAALCTDVARGARYALKKHPDCLSKEVELGANRALV